MKPWPAHHKRVRVPFSTVAEGYGGAHTFRGLPGLWQVIAADTDEGPESWPLWPANHGTIGLIVAPVRGGK
jgi:hypothetical protein